MSEPILTWRIQTLPAQDDSTNGPRIELRSPAVGYLTHVPALGSALAPGQEAGYLLRLGKPYKLVLPEGVAGIVSTPGPEAVHAAVSFDQAILQLRPLDEFTLGAELAGEELEQEGALVLRSPQAGRFYHKAAPEDPPFVSAGSSLNEGDPIGLIEVMKTFSQVLYATTGNLPKNAKVVRLLVEDGADVTKGMPLVELEPA
jgi:acetyl-CoA carboxylase biotin carboxyl carrier protein